MEVTFFIALTPSLYTYKSSQPNIGNVSHPGLCSPSTWLGLWFSALAKRSEPTSAKRCPISSSLSTAAHSPYCLIFLKTKPTCSCHYAMHELLLAPKRYSMNPNSPAFRMWNLHNRLLPTLSPASPPPPLSYCPTTLGTVQLRNLQSASANRTFLEPTTPFPISVWCPLTPGKNLPTSGDDSHSFSLWSHHFHIPVQQSAEDSSQACLLLCLPIWAKKTV